MKQFHPTHTERSDQKPGHKKHQQFAEYQEQQKKIQKMKEAIRRLRQWANEASPPNPDLFRKAKMMEKMLARIELVKKPKVEKQMNLVMMQNK